MDKEKYKDYLEVKKEVKKSIKKLLKSEILKDKSEETIVAYISVKYRIKCIGGMVRVILSDETWAKRFKCVNNQYSENEE